MSHTPPPLSAAARQPMPATWCAARRAEIQAAVNDVDHVFEPNQARTFLIELLAQLKEETSTAATLREQLAARDESLTVAGRQMCQAQRAEGIALQELAAQAKKHRAKLTGLLLEWKQSTAGSDHLPPNAVSGFTARHNEFFDLKARSLGVWPLEEAPAGIPEPLCPDCGGRANYAHDNSACLTCRAKARGEVPAGGGVGSTGSQKGGAGDD